MRSATARLKLVIVGNCQARPLGRIIGEMYPSVEVLEPVIVHLAKPSDADSALTRLSGADAVFSQTVASNYPTEFVQTASLERAFPGRVVPWLNVYWRGQNPELTYRRDLPAAAFPLLDYHLTTVMEGLAEGDDDDEIARKLADRDFNRERYGGVASQSLGELRKREADSAAPITDYIEEHGTSIRLFLTFNHPTLQLMVEYAVRLMRTAFGISPTHHLDPLARAEPLAPIVPPPNPISGLPAWHARTYFHLVPRGSGGPGGLQPRTEREVVAMFRAAYRDVEPLCIVGAQPLPAE